MANLLSTLFASNEMYLSKHVSGLNKRQTFPVRNRIPMREFLSGVSRDSILISGGTDEERSVFLTGIVRAFPGCTVMLHNGNPYMTVERLRHYGINAENWHDNIYEGMTKAQMISLLTENEKDDDLSFFFSFALEVCEVLGKPLTLASLSQIDWLGIGWQEKLLSVRGQRERAMDLLSRYDRHMAASSVRGMCRIERLTRSHGNANGTSVDSGLRNGRVVVKAVYGSQSAITKQCLAIVQEKAEEGQNFTLVLDDVYVDAPIIRDNFRNVRLILSGADITQYADNMRLTNRVCSVVAFNHAAYGSARAISEYYFGEYDRLYSDISTGNSRSFLSPTTHNKNVTVRQSRDTRLKPENLTAIPVGVAFVKLCNGVEGYLDMR